MLKIYTNGQVVLDGNPINLYVKNESNGTRFYDKDGNDVNVSNTHRYYLNGHKTSFASTLPSLYDMEIDIKSYLSRK